MSQRVHDIQGFWWGLPIFPPAYLIIVPPAVCDAFYIHHRWCRSGDAGPNVPSSTRLTALQYTLLGAGNLYI